MRVRYGPITKGYFLPGWLDLAPEEMYKKMARQGNPNAYLKSRTSTNIAFKGHGFITSKMVRVIKTDIEEVVDVKKDGLEIGEIVFTGSLPTL